MTVGDTQSSPLSFLLPIKFQRVDLTGDGKYRWNVIASVQSKGERACTYSDCYKLLYSTNSGVMKLSRM